jgi:hypothetical protein
MFFQVLPDRARLPEIVVGGVVDIHVPQGCLVLEILLVGVGERAHAQIEIVAIRRAEVERAAAGGGAGSPSRLRNPMIEAEAVRQHERAVVIDIVAHVVIGDGRLRRDRHQRRMRVDHAGGGVEIPAAKCPTSRPCRYCRERSSPASRWCRRCRCFRRHPWAVLHGLVRADGDVIAFAHEAAAHVLIDEDELLALEELGGSRLARYRSRP